MAPGRLASLARDEREERIGGLVIIRRSVRRIVQLIAIQMQEMFA